MYLGNVINTILETIFYRDMLDEKENCVYLKADIMKVTTGDTLLDKIPNK